MSFTENNHNGLIYMSSDKIGARHAFTTRYGGVSTGIFSSLNLGSNRGDDPEAVRENYRRVCELMGVGIDDMAVTQQVHKADVRIVTSADKHVCMSHVPYEADGIVTSERGLPIMCMVADCVPVLLYDGEHSVAGAIHCGWRSSVGDILRNALDAMASLGAKAQSVHAAIGPSIGRCCFETDDDVPDAMRRALGGAAEPYMVRRGEKWHIDLKGINALWLRQAGVQRIDVCPDCTGCHPERWWSHRKMGDRRGAQAALIALI